YSLKVILVMEYWECSNADPVLLDQHDGWMYASIIARSKIFYKITYDVSKLILYAHLVIATNKKLCYNPVFYTLLI
ncbi:hypothetical protein, partial [Moraxella catarrhalis]|uniref:hypothetical protein n=1 Tax=Moraxella catarrhalis TaxID=480 RepID=UPI001D0DA799